MMRVLLVGPEWVGRWTESTHKALSDLGHAAHVFYYNSLRVEQFSLGLGRRAARASPRLAAWFADYRVRWERAMNRRLREHARASRPDLVLVLKGESLEAETVDCLQRAARKRLVTWWLDDPFGSRLSPEAIRFYHTWFLFDRSYFERLARAGAAESVFLPCCCDPDIFRPLGLKPAYDVTFVGVYYPQRGAALEQLRGFNVGVWGPLWDGTEAQRVLNHLGTNWRGKFADQKTAVKIHNASRICLNVHHPQTRLGGLNLRTFEVLASGASLLTDYIAGMDELLVPGEEVACYSSPDQVRPQVDYYLAHPDERLRISQRGRARVLREHTYHHRMKTILDKLGLGDE